MSHCAAGPADLPGDGNGRPLSGRVAQLGEDLQRLLRSGVRRRGPRPGTGGRRTAGPLLPPPHQDGPVAVGEDTSLGKRKKAKAVHTIRYKARDLHITTKLVPIGRRPWKPSLNWS